MISITTNVGWVVGSCIVKKNRIASRVLILIALIINVMTAFVSIGVYSLIDFIGGFIVSILFMLASILSYVVKI